MPFSNGEYVSVLHNVLKHTNTPNTELLISNPGINLLYHFSHCLISFKTSNNSIWWGQLLTNAGFLLTK